MQDLAIIVMFLGAIATVAFGVAWGIAKARKGPTEKAKKRTLSAAVVCIVAMIVGIFLRRICC